MNKRTSHQQATDQLRIHIDEAGRGPLAGPVTVGLIMSLRNFPKNSFRDSKQLTHQQRVALYQRIYQHHGQGDLCYATGWASNQEIDQLGIIDALHLAVCRGLFVLCRSYYDRYWQQQLADSPFGEDKIALLHLEKLFSARPNARKQLTHADRTIQQIIHLPQSVASFDTLLIDGNHTFNLDIGLNTNVITIIKGDQKNPLISMASIVAKVERDRWMSQQDHHHVTYKFAQHKGYATAEHRELIHHHGISVLHRRTFCSQITTVSTSGDRSIPLVPSIKARPSTRHQKPSLLLHICCAPDLTRPLHRLKEYFKLHLFRYNPNIHPRAEHGRRYDQFLKLVGLEPGDYEILEDRYDPKEFFDAMFDMRALIHERLRKSKRKEVLKLAGEMEERTDRCNPCYAMRLHQAARTAAQHDIPYFTSTLLISPKKNMDKLFTRGVDAEKAHPTTKFLRFDFSKNDGYHEAVRLTRKHQLWRQNYCGCGWTVPKPGETTANYRGG